MCQPAFKSFLRKQEICVSSPVGKSLIYQPPPAILKLWTRWLRRHSGVIVIPLVNVGITGCPHWTRTVMDRFITKTNIGERTDSLGILRMVQYLQGIVCCTVATTPVAVVLSIYGWAHGRITIAIWWTRAETGIKWLVGDLNDGISKDNSWFWQTKILARPFPQKSKKFYKLGRP